MPGRRGAGPASNYPLCDRALPAQNSRNSLVHLLPHQVLRQTTCTEPFVLVTIPQRGHLWPTTHYAEKETSRNAECSPEVMKQGRGRGRVKAGIGRSLSYLEVLRSSGPQLQAGLMGLRARKCSLL